MAQDKRIEDYLHLYLGCECMTPKGIGKLFRYDIETNWTWCVFGIMGPDFEDSGHIESIKLILRPLSDMSEEEKLELKKIEWPDNDDKCYKYLGCIYLLSKHFDLFNLHEAGLCLYKTDLK